MKICLIGNSITSLVLAKILLRKKINVSLFYEKKRQNFSKSRTIGISKNNCEFLANKVIRVTKKDLWKINSIEIYSEKLANKKLINFKKNENEFFSIIRNDDLYNLLEKDLKKEKLFKKKQIKKKSFYNDLLKDKKYKLIINCVSKNDIDKKYFYNKVTKDYNSFAYTTIIKHKKILNENAVQIFTKLGPLAFLPISNFETSVVYSIRGNNKDYSKKEIIKFIEEYNKKYKILSFNKIDKFELKFILSRKYSYENIINFGDSIHKIHPLAGQGFNMTLRDISILSDIIQSKIDLGLDFDQSICQEFQDKAKHKNFIFSSGIDFIYEIFNQDKKFKNTYFLELINLLGKSEQFNKIFSDRANRGLTF